MPIGPERLLELVNEEGLVSNLSERELTNPEGAGFDLRIGEIYTISGDAFLGIEERKTPTVTLVARYEKDEKNSYTLKPGDYVLFKTMESVKLPVDIAGYTFSRSTTFRSGLIFASTQIAPGYEGELTFALKNDGPCEVTIELGARVAHVQFEYVEGGGSGYRGQWTHGRVSAEKMEKQV